MSRNRFDKITCSLARALDQAGDWWTLLIVRDALRGVDSFEGFRESLGIARNILSERLSHLQNHGLLRKDTDQRDARRTHYSLTDKGKALAPALVALMQWGDAWISGRNGEPIVLRDRRTNGRVADISLRSESGTRVGADDLLFTIGPGADAAMRARAAGNAANSRGGMKERRGKRGKSRQSLSQVGQ